MDPETNDNFTSFFTRKPYNGRYMWLNIVIFGSTHLIGAAGLYYMFQAKIYTWIAWALYYHACILGVTVGAHRLCAHRTFKANFPLKVLVTVLFTMSWQQRMVTWARWHRCHHKWSDTDADPHNINRGFWFAHIGWLMIRPHPEFTKKQDLIDMSDLENDPVYSFQSKYYYILALFSGIILPHMSVMLIWKEEPIVCFTTGILAWVLHINSTGLVNSVCHLWGMRPFDYKIKPAESTFSNFLVLGEGHHNYHHTFPMDYRASELGALFNPSTRFIDFFAWLGWATELKSMKPERVEKRKAENALELELSRKTKTDSLRG